MKDKILKEAINWYKQHENKNEIYIEDFVDLVIDKTTDALFHQIKEEFEDEFQKGNLKHPFIISSDYYLYLKLKEIKNKFVKNQELDTSDKEITTEKFD
jgi:intein/homing endonuclease